MVPRGARRRGCAGRTMFRAALAVSTALLGLILLGVPLARWLSYPPSPRPSDAIVVLGGRLTARMEHAITYYQRGFGPQIWHTGDVPPPGARLSQAGRARMLAVAEGVPREAITLLATRSTWEDGAAVAALARARGAERLLLVTDWTHSRRAICTMRRHLAGSGVTVAYATPPPVGYTPESWWRSLDGLAAMRRELPALAYYWARYGVNPFRC